MVKQKFAFNFKSFLYCFYTSTKGKFFNNGVNCLIPWWHWSIFGSAKEFNESVIQFVIFKPLSYCFWETIGFDVKASFASRPRSRLISWYNKPGDITKEFREKAIQFHGTFHGLKITNWIDPKCLLKVEATSFYFDNNLSFSNNIFSCILLFLFEKYSSHAFQIRLELQLTLSFSRYCNLPHLFRFVTRFRYHLNLTMSLGFFDLFTLVLRNDLIIICFRRFLLK